MSDSIPPNALNTIVSELVKYKSLKRWKPAVGDFIVRHKWFSHWYGVICGSSSDGEVCLVKEGLPHLLFTLNPEEIEEKKEFISYNKIINSKNGDYAILQSQNGISVWYV